MDYKNRIRSLQKTNPIILKEGTHAHLLNNIGKLSNKEHPLRQELLSTYGRKSFPSYGSFFYDMTILTDSKLVVELGTRRGVSTSAFVSGLKVTGGKIYTFDPQDKLQRQKLSKGWEPYLEFHKMLGEEAYKKYKEKVKDIDILYIDTDPHTYEQTKMWLNEYWIHNVRPGGFVMLDDCSPKQQTAVKGKHGYGILRAVLEYLDENYAKIDYCFSVANHHSGIAVIKLI